LAAARVEENDVSAAAALETLAWLDLFDWRSPWNCASRFCGARRSPQRFSTISIHSTNRSPGLQPLGCSEAAARD
jgi:hypothetical protein